MDAKMFGAFLAQVRRAQGLTQAELAEQLHVTDKAAAGNAASVCRTSIRWNLWPTHWACLLRT